MKIIAKLSLFDTNYRYNVVYVFDGKAHSMSSGNIDLTEQSFAEDKIRLAQDVVDSINAENNTQLASVNDVVWI